MVARDGVPQVVGVVSWGHADAAARLRRGPGGCQRARPHLALIAGAFPARTAPYATRQPRITSKGCYRGRWRPAGDST